MKKTLSVCGGIGFDTEKATIAEAYSELKAACEKAGILLIADTLALFDENGNEIEEA